jgi:hypothetical protein
VWSEVQNAKREARSVNKEKEGFSLNGVSFFFKPFETMKFHI